MHHTITDAVDRYLKVDSDHALLINGKWGVGKTHCLKKIIMPSIARTETLKNASKKYLPIYVSLFGINSISDLERTIFTETFSFLKSSAGKKVAGLTKAIAKGYLEQKGFGDLDKHLKDLGIEKFPVKKYDDIVVCLDDLERKGEGLSIKELAGYINHLCDGFGIKIIVVMNEKSLDESDEKVFKELKEKVIGVQIDFIQNYRDSFQNIVSELFEHSQIYQAFLNEHFKVFDQFSFTTEGNLRHLKYLMLNFEPIFSELELYKQDHPTKKDIIKVIVSELPNLLKFALAMTIEFRNSQLSYSQRNGLGENNVADRLLEVTNPQAAKEKESYHNGFIAKYYPNENFRFYESIFESITGGPKFDLNKLLEELKQFFGIINDTMPEQFQVLQRLSSSKVYDLSDREYAKEITKLYEFAKKGLYKIGDYLVIFKLIMLYENVNDYDIPSLLNDLKAGVVEASKNMHSEATFNQRFVVPLDDYIKEYRELDDHIKKYIKNSMQSVHNQHYNTLKQVLFTSPGKMYDLITTDKNLRDWEHKPFFTGDLFDEFKMKFDEYQNHNINDLTEFFGIRYANGYFDVYFQDERPFFQKMINHIESRLSNAPKSLSSGLLRDLKSQMNNIIGS